MARAWGQPWLEAQTFGQHLGRQQEVLGRGCFCLGELRGGSSWQQEFPRGIGLAWLLDRTVGEKPQEEEAALTGVAVRAAPSEVPMVDVAVLERPGLLPWGPPLWVGPSSPCLPVP